MANFQINFKSGVPVYLQLVEQVRAAAATGTFQAGEALPSIRPLAEELRINRNTVAKAYSELESQGIVETIPGKGCFVRENNSPLKKEIRSQMLREQIDALLVSAYHLQFTREEVLKLVRERWDDLEQRQSKD
jgi:GntR family transcriptional regulator